jgi:hypothetical protein
LIFDQLTRQLFGKFPREVGIRSNIYSMDAMQRYLVENDGVTDCYTSIYTLDYEIDKIFFDFDGYASALEDAKKVCKWLVAEGHPVAVVASGKKGVHIYCLLKPIPTTKEILSQATWGILKAVFGDRYTKTTADPHCIGDIRRISRIPNTRRPPDNRSWCTPLPPEFLNFRWMDVVLWAKMPHEFSEAPRPTQTINDLPHVKLSDIANITPSLIAQPVVSGPSNDLLKAYLRPCLFNAISVPNPMHVARVATATDLLQVFNPEDVRSLLEPLNWLDWNNTISLSQIKSCKHLKPYTCSKLRSIGMCMFQSVRDCPYRNLG